ncbi:MAG: DUF1963 domain-containing protein [Lachnospiraceae bacterium]|nr:DUF1963 domain-containing protein [Lachnospiraceae bacterium]
MSNLIKFEDVNNEMNIQRIGGKSFLPNDIKWPVNPNGDKLVLILNLPTNFLNTNCETNFPKDMIISVFTTYNPEDYFLDSIVYHGNAEELDNIKNGFTQVILHPIGSLRNDSEFLIPARKIIVEKEINKENEYYGSLLGNPPVFLQQERLELDSYQFCMQIYGEDFPDEFQDIFYLDESIGYLFLNKEGNLNDTGLFFTQCS